MGAQVVASQNTAEAFESLEKSQKHKLVLTCIVTSLSSTITSFVRKSAPIVALYWLLNFLFTYWFIRDVFPTLSE